MPYIGWFLTAAVALYSLMFQGQLIGLIYRTKTDALGMGVNSEMTATRTPANATIATNHGTQHTPRVADLPLH